MPAKVTADYSKFPEPIRDVMPYVEGEVHELRNCWQIYHCLFMQDEQMTKFYGERFGPILAVLQNLLAKEMILSISRLTDKHNRAQKNLSIWSLKEAVPFAKSPDFETKVKTASDEIEKLVENSRLRRHKEIGHFDLDVSLGKSPVPEVLLGDIKNALEKFEEFLNLFQWEFEHTTVGYENLSSGEFTATMLETAIKSKVYDELESEKVILFGEYENRISNWPWWKWPD